MWWKIKRKESNPLPEEQSAVRKVVKAPVVPEEEIKTKKLTPKDTKNLHNNPYEDGEIMSCCGQKYCFSYDRMKYLPRNPKLKYRLDGTVDKDPFSRSPGNCDYNGAREAIRQAKIKGFDHVHWRVSSATANELERDGYRGSDGGRLMNKDNDKICWDGKNPWKIR